MGVVVAEDFAWDDEQVSVDCLGNEVGAVSAMGCPDIEVEGSAGLAYVVVVGEFAADEIASFFVAGDFCGHIHMECGEGAVLGHTRRADESELLQFDHFLNES